MAIQTNKLIEKLTPLSNEEDLLEVIRAIVDNGDDYYEYRKSIRIRTEKPMPEINSVYGKFILEEKRRRIMEEGDVYYVSELTPDTTIIMDSLGVTLMSVNEVNGKIKEERIYKWNDFHILRKYNIARTRDIDHIDYHYNFVLNGNLYVDFLFQDMKTMLRDDCCQGKSPNIITCVLQEYSQNVEDVSDRYSYAIGFLNKGWALPPDYMFTTQDAIFNKIRINIQKMMDLNVNKKDALQYFNILYKNITIEFRDIIIALMFATPFWNVFRDIEGLGPLICLTGPQDNGKSEIMKIMNKIIFTVSDDELDGLVNNDLIKSFARFASHLSASTFAVCVDETENVSDDTFVNLKAHSTSALPFNRMNPKRQLIVDSITVAGIWMSQNYLPHAFKDDATLSRILGIPFDKTIENPNYKENMEKIPRGYIGRYFIDCTSNWNRHVIAELIRTFPDLGFHKRERSICRYVQFGAHLVKEFFDIDLNITRLGELLTSTKNAEFTDMLDTIKYMAFKGLDTDFYGKFKSTDWVKYETICKQDGTVHGILIDRQRLKALLLEWGGIDTLKKIKLPAFKDLLSRRLTGIEFKKYSYHSHSFDAVFIPCTHIIGVNTDMRKYVVEVSKEQIERRDKEFEENLKQSNKDIANLYDEVNEVKIDE